MVCCRDAVVSSDVVAVVTTPTNRVEPGRDVTAGVAVSVATDADAKDDAVDDTCCESSDGLATLVEDDPASDVVIRSRGAVVAGDSVMVDFHVPPSDDVESEVRPAVAVDRTTAAVLVVTAAVEAATVVDGSGVVSRTMLSL